MKSTVKTTSTGIELAAPVCLHPQGFSWLEAGALITTTLASDEIVRRGDVMAEEASAMLAAAWFAAVENFCAGLQIMIEAAGIAMDYALAGLAVLGL